MGCNVVYLFEGYEKLAEAENQIKNGEKLLDAEAVFESLKDRYGK